MNIINFLLFFFISQISLALENNKPGVRIVKVTQIVDKTFTNTHVVDAPTTTVVNWLTATTTSTTTHYTSTITSTIFGEAYTYLSVFSSVVPVVDNGNAVIDSPTETTETTETTDTTNLTDIKDTKDTKENKEATNITNMTYTAETTETLGNRVTETTQETTQETTHETIQEDAPEFEPIASSHTTAALHTNNKEDMSESSFKINTEDSRTAIFTSSADSVKTPIAQPSVPTVQVSVPTIVSESSAMETTPSTTADESHSFVTSQTTIIPSVWEGYTLGDSTTAVSNSICFVDYNYYSQDYTETIYSTSRVYITVTV